MYDDYGFFVNVNGLKSFRHYPMRHILHEHYDWLMGDNMSRRADFREVDLRCIEFKFVNLARADFRGANLEGAKFDGANLFGAEFDGANLSHASFNGANLSTADFYGANLRGTDFTHANLSGAHFDEDEIARFGVILNEPMIGYKKCRNDTIVELEIPAGAIVFSINGKKCRTNQAVVKKIHGANRAFSTYNYFSYYVGDRINIKNFDLKYNTECAEGIHFFKSYGDAALYII